MDNIKKVAVLIDAENISFKYAKLILNEASKLGNVICRRIYGDWSAPGMQSWKTPIMENSIMAIQQFQNTHGKNSSDSALLIDAMDLLHDGKYQYICIVSSDSDFTRLAARLREEEITVVGMGERKTPSSFISACEKFLYLDLLYANENQESQNIPESNSSDLVSCEPSCIANSDTDTKASGLDKVFVISVIDDIIINGSDDEGWINMAQLGIEIQRRIPDFDVRNFGSAKLGKFIQSVPEYELKEIPNQQNPNIKVIYVRKP